MRTIALINAKGGCGKTTIATSLASALAWEGHSVALADMDPQRSSADWLAQRPESAPPVAGLVDVDSRPPAGTDTLILDTPAGLAGSELDQIIRRAQTVLVPVMPSPVDMRAAWRFLSHLQELKAVRSGQTAIGLVANRVRPQTIIYRELTGFLDGFRVPVVGQLRDTMNYVRAFEKGLAVADLPPYLAWQDWEEWETVLAWIRSRHSQGRAGSSGGLLAAAMQRLTGG
ncbi:ParA family protein [Wenzhouxiangella limi]|uniref:ParA family protein n=1 Tax=Wenzhouxiangella limi TaxID=2707351 RepID=A0A845UYK7_9GAMM|nr:ParA family protein [Wenzhouxiangella limi]NDY96497.1 ParA family protein [Wenzhouxiangella limi]